MKLFIQIPCYNEEKTLPEVIRDLPKQIDGIDEIEIMIVDDGSTDKTIEVARSLGIKHIIEHGSNRGLAMAFRHGSEYALAHGADILVNTDGDNKYFGGDIGKLCQPIIEGKADLVVGCRPIVGHKEFSPIKKLLQLMGSWTLRRISKTTVRDGGSTDNTLGIIASYQLRFPGKIRIVGSSHSDALANFSTLLQEATADLVMFCDHDDVWKPDKISVTLEKYGEMETQLGKGTPIMVFTDSEVSDKKLNRISPSMIRFQHLDPSHLSLNYLIVQNVPYGNTMLVNRALIDLALPIPTDAVMHDHWLSLVASAFGKIGFVDKALLYYRQHENNVYGASSYSRPTFFYKLKLGPKKLSERFAQNIIQGAAFGRRYADRLSKENLELCKALSAWRELGFWGRRRVLWKYRILKSGILRNLGAFFFV